MYLCKNVIAYVYETVEIYRDIDRELLIESFST